MNAFQSSDTHSLRSLYRVATFDVTGCKTSTTPSVIFCFVHRNARQESSKFYSDLRNASSLEQPRDLEYKWDDSFCSAAIELCILLAMRKYLVTWLCDVNAAALWRQCSRSIEGYSCHKGNGSHFAESFMHKLAIESLFRTTYLPS